jgi:hypothetical protein
MHKRLKRGDSLSSGTWVAICLPLFILFFVLLPADQKASLRATRRKKKGETRMTNELIKRYIGKNCIIASGSFGQTVKGVISAVEDNWIEMQTKLGSRLVNADYVTYINETDK